MRKGIAYLPGLSSSSHTPLPSHVLGIPVEYHPDSKHAIADARGFGAKAKIAVGPVWHRLDAPTQMAVLYHEAGHIIGRHREKRAAMLLLLAAPSLILLPWVILCALGATAALYFIIERLAQNQESAADRFAAANGYGESMLNFVRAAGPPPSVPFFYPDFERRCGAIARYLKERK
jgi:hypothetical protein